MNLMCPAFSAIRAATAALAMLLPVAALAQTAPPLLPLERQIASREPVLNRVAVVLGLSSYRDAPQLRNPVNDARAVAAMLRTFGFRVLEGYDLDKIGVERLLRDAVMAGGARSELVVYFAGHGIQIAEQNYLLPIDAQLRDPYDVPFQTISLDSILDTLRGQSGTQVAFLDACRNNPFEGSAAINNVRGIGSPILRGFSQPQPPSNTLLSFSTAPGALAQDGGGSNSPYAAALVGAAGISPDSPIDTILSAVEKIVEDSTGGQQRPVFASALSRPFVLRTPVFSPMVVAAQPALIPTPTGGASTPVTPGTIAAPTASVLHLVEDGSSFGGSEEPDVPGDVIAPRERIIAIGQRLLEILNLTGAQIVLGTPPAGTSFAMVANDGSIVEAPTAPIPASAMGAVVLRLDEVAAKNVSPTRGITTQTLTFDRLDPGGFRTPRALTVSIVPNACDVEAGDWFDPQGVGIHRLDDALRAEPAIAACSVALQVDPSNARFRYQLARGMNAANRNGEAETLARQAAEAGHVRAWLTYGKLLKERGDLNGASAAFQQGQRGGDPRATAALGALMLENAQSDGEREAAYELLTEGIDLGLWEAMEAQSLYFNGAGSNPARASRYFEEAQRRRADVVPASVPNPQTIRRGNSVPQEAGGDRGGDRGPRSNDSGQTESDGRDTPGLQ